VMGTSIGWMQRVQRLLAVGGMTPTRQYVHTLEYFHPEELAELCTPEFLLATKGVSSIGIFAETLQRYSPKELLDRLMYLDLHHYLPDCLMVKMDIASMANSLETRSPLLDHVLAQEVARWPSAWKYRAPNTSKKILKETFAKDLPEVIRRRGKQGFGVPISQWFRGPLKSYLREVILSPKALQRGYFRPETVHRYVDEHQSGKRDRAYGLWALLMLELWHCSFPPDRQGSLQ
jgi:asparagine synthase (glutamine-hydrolysing)